MMNYIFKKNCLFLIALCWVLTIHAQTSIWESNGWECHIGKEGTLEEIIFPNDTIHFFSEGRYAGPAFYVNMGGEDIVSHWIPDSIRTYRAVIDGVECRMTYKEWMGQPAIEISLTNKGHVPFQPVKAGLKLGIDTYMDKYPDWFGKYFPTLMRNEKTHFYGYLQTPKGDMLGIVSPQPVASWSMDYNLGYQDPAPHWFMGHHIESVNIDLMNALPLPSRCPQNLWCLKQGESKTWNIAFVPVNAPEEWEKTIYRVAGIPMIRMEQTTFCPGETAAFEVLASNPSISIADDRDAMLPFSVQKEADGASKVTCILPETGLYTIRVTDGEKQSEGILSARASWEQILRQARAGALKYQQKATSHVESCYGFYSSFLAAEYFPEKQIDDSLHARFDYLFSLLYDKEKMEPLYHASRIQNTSSIIGILVDKYEAYKDKKDLENASRLADWLINTWQRDDGAYVNHNTVYTSVIYVAKNILELVLAERKADMYEEAERHYLSAKRAIDQLVLSQGNFETEGELTFEDGMVSCSALQMGMLALMQTDQEIRSHYTDAMLQVLESHDCLAQLRVPDARQRGGTMRFWEAQYDVQMLPNMFNSPHGWSAWRAYATYYAYLLTGNERWLKETYNATGAFANLIDYRTGDLRWAFVVDPYVKAKQACSADTSVTADSLSFGNPHPELYDTREFVVGEQYVNMISDWQPINTQDNDVHEVFKCISETMLTNAFIVERTDGEIVGYNCRVTRQGNRLDVQANEKQITNLHANLKKTYTVTFNGKTSETGRDYLGWLFGQDIYLLKTY